MYLVQLFSESHCDDPPWGIFQTEKTAMKEAHELIDRIRNDDPLVDRFVVYSPSLGYKITDFLRVTVMESVSPGKWREVADLYLDDAQPTITPQESL